MAQNDPLSEKLRDEHVHIARLNAVITDVVRELNAQVVKWGIQDHRDGFWFLILVEEMGEAAGALLKHYTGHLTAPEMMILHRAAMLGAEAKFILEGEKPSRINPGEQHDTDHELIQVAAVATAMVENRRRNH
jgi:hypothetical protein